MRIMGDILSRVEEGEEIATQDTCFQFGSILNQLQQNAPASSIQQTFASLEPSQQAAISSAMQNSNRSPVVTP